MATSTHDPMRAGAAHRVEPVTEQQVKRARVVVAGNAPRGQVHEILKMLGIANPLEVRLETDGDVAA